MKLNRSGIFRVTAVAGLAAMAFSLVGCAQASSTSGHQTVELAIVAAGETPSAYQNQVKRFNDSQSDITLKIRTYPSGDAYNQAILGQVAGGAAPDIVSLDAGQQTKTYADAKAILPLKDEAAKAGIDLTTFDKKLVDASTVGGTLYAIPRDYSTTALFYSKSAFAQAGLTPPTTWDELRADAKTLTSNGRYGLGMYPQLNYFLAWIDASGGNFVTAGGLKGIDNKGHLDAITQLNSFFNVDKSAASPQMTGASWDGEMLAKKQVAMVFGGSWILGGIPADVAKDVGVVALPAAKQTGSVLYSTGWAITAASKHADAAAKVIAFLTSDAELKTGHKDGIVLLPAKPSVLSALASQSDDPLLKIAQAGAANGIPFGWLTTKQVDTYNQNLAGMISSNGSQTPKQTLDSITTQLSK